MHNSGVTDQEPYRSAPRVFWIMDNGSSHRGERGDKRIHNKWKTIVPVHTPVHASWLNQVEIYFLGRVTKGTDAEWLWFRHSSRRSPSTVSGTFMRAWQNLSVEVHPAGPRSTSCANWSDRVPPGGSCLTVKKYIIEFWDWATRLAVRSAGRTIKKGLFADLNATYL